MSRDAFRQYLSEVYPAFSAAHVAPSGPPPGPSVAPGGASIAIPGLLPAPEAAPPVTFPEFRRASEIIPGQIELPPVQIEGLLHEGCKLIVSGGSKSFKSWVLLHLAICMAHGIPFWGMQVTKGTVLYLNFELIDGFLDWRIDAICRHLNCALPHNLLIWNLRYKCYDLQQLKRVLESRINSIEKVSLIILDPLYKTYGPRNENDASDMTAHMNDIEDLGAKLGASVAFGSHFSKGNQASKDPKDRPSGSGVLIRDPDAILTMTRHRDEDCYTVSSELRYMPRLPEFVVRWDFPVMSPDESKDPRQLLQAGVTAPREADRPSFSVDDVLANLPHSGAQDTLWRHNVTLAFGSAGTAFYEAKAQLLRESRVVKRGLKYFPTQFRFEPVK